MLKLLICSKTNNLFLIIDTFPVKNGLFSANSRFVLQNGGTYLPRVTGETFTSNHKFATIEIIGFYLLKWNYKKHVCLTGWGTIFEFTKFEIQSSQVDAWYFWTTVKPELTTTSGCWPLAYSNHHFGIPIEVFIT
jgi:hypothetical protein